MNAITEFTGDHAFLSNFYPCKVRYNGEDCKSAESAFQAAKTNESAWKSKIANLDAKTAKVLGRKIKLREDWEDVKIDIMGDIVWAKFSQNPRLGDALLATGDARLIEGNTWNDTFWGVCNGTGENYLGQILEEVREKLREVRAASAIRFVEGDMFASDADVLVNAVNCEGVMGAGLALEFKKRFPAMFEDYREVCKRGDLHVGSAHIYTMPAERATIVNVPTKRSWKMPSYLADVEVGLRVLAQYLKNNKNVRHVAVPALGCGLGGLDTFDVRQLAIEHLSDLDCEVLLYNLDD